MSVVPIYAFLRHSGKVLDFLGENPTMCLRHCFALGDMDYDNHNERGQTGIYIHISCTMLSYSVGK